MTEIGTFRSFSLGGLTGRFIAEIRRSFSAPLGIDPDRNWAGC